MSAQRLIAVSLCLNLVLGVVLIRGYRRSTPMGQPTLATKEITNRSLRLDARRSPLDASSTQPPAVAVVVDEAFRWAQLESADYRVYVANLRAIGCPEETVRDIIIPDVNELFYRRVKGLVDTVQNRFWEFLADKKALQKLVEEKQGQLEALDKERDAVLKELLGPRADHRLRANELAEIEQVAARKQFLDFLPADKIDRCLALDEKFKNLREQIAGAEPPLESKELQAKYKRLKEQQDGEFEAILAPEELAEYKLRNSRFADTRLRLTGFDAGEAELKEMVRIQEKFAGASPGVNGQVALTSEAQKQQRDELKKMLGVERFVEYERAQDNRYQEMYQVADRLQLPAKAASDAYEVRAAAEALAQQVRTDQTIPEDKRTAQLGAIRAETERALVETFGQKAFELYQTRSGQWLAQLAGVKP